MAPSQDDLLQRIERLERRLAELERSVGRAAAPAERPGPLDIEPVAPVEPTAHAAENLEHLLEVKKRVDDQLDEKPAVEPSVDAPPSPTSPAPPPTPPTPPTPATSATPPTPVASSAPPLAPPLAPAARRSEPDRGSTPRYRDQDRVGSDLIHPDRAAARPKTSLEQLVGGKWMAWVGALVVVVAVAFFLSYAYEEGWWGRLSETTRCLLGAGFGLVMMVGGELALRRISRAASVGLYGAGIAILYLVSFGAFNYYGLISQQASFLLMGAVAIVGFAVTLRTRFRTIGILSILGGYATPILLSRGGGHDLEVLSFLTMLLAISLALSATVPREFRVLRYVAFGAQSLFALGWLVTRGQSHWELAVVFTTIWWAMLLAECTLAALRRQSAYGNVMATLLATAGYVTAATWILDGAQPPGGFDWLGPFTAGVGLLCAAVALQFGPGIETLRAPPRTAMDKLALALLAQFGVLLAVAVGLQFDGYGESIGWLAIALASVELARRLPSRGVGVFGVIVGILATARTWAIWGLGQLGLTSTTLQTVVDFGGVSLSGWALLTLAAIVVAHVAARRLGLPAAAGDRFRPWRYVAVIIAALASLEWLGLWTVEWTGLPATGAWLAGAVILLALHRWSTPLFYLEIAIGMLVATAGRWLLVNSLLERAAPLWDPQASLPFINPQMGLAVAIGVVGWWACRIAWRRGDADRPASGAMGWLQGVVMAGVLFVLVAFSFEIDRVIARMEVAGTLSTPWPPLQLRALWWTALWSAGGLAVVQLGRRRRLAAVATGGLVIVALGAFAWLSADTLGFRLADGVVFATPVLNLQFAVGVLMVVVLAVTARTVWRLRDDEAFEQQTTTINLLAILGLLAAVGLWLGSMEIDRAFAERMASQAGLSIYWSVYGLGLIVVGFIFRAAAARYAGLALLSLTVVKVLFIDLSHLDQIWRIASFLVSGMLLIGTSIVYSKLSPRLLEKGRDLGTEGLRD